MKLRDINGTTTADTFHKQEKLDSRLIRAAVNPDLAAELVYDQLMDLLGFDLSAAPGDDGSKERTFPLKELKKKKKFNPAFMKKPWPKDIPKPSQLEIGQTLTMVTTREVANKPNTNEDGEREVGSPAVATTAFLEFSVRPPQEIKENGPKKELFMTPSSTGAFSKQKAVRVDGGKADAIAENMKLVNFNSGKEVPTTTPMLDPSKRGISNKPSELATGGQSLTYRGKDGSIVKFLMDPTVDKTTGKIVQSLVRRTYDDKGQITSTTPVDGKVADQEAASLTFVSAKGGYDAVKDMFKGKSEAERTAMMQDFLKNLDVVRQNWERVSKQLSQATSGGNMEAPYRVIDRDSDKPKLKTVQNRATKTDRQELQRAMEYWQRRVQKFGNIYLRIAGEFGGGLDKDGNITWLKDQMGNLTSAKDTLDLKDKDEKAWYNDEYGPGLSERELKTPTSSSQATDPEARKMYPDKEDKSFTEKKNLSPEEQKQWDAQKAITNRKKNLLDKLKAQNSLKKDMEERKRLELLRSNHNLTREDAFKLDGMDDMTTMQTKFDQIKMSPAEVEELRNIHLKESPNYIPEGERVKPDELKQMENKRRTDLTKEYEENQRMKGLRKVELINRAREYRNLSNQLNERKQLESQPNLDEAQKAKLDSMPSMEELETKMDTLILSPEEAAELKSLIKPKTGSRVAFGTGISNTFQVKVTHESGSPASPNELSGMLKSLGTSGIVEQMSNDGVFRMDLPEELEHKLIMDGKFKVQIDQFILESVDEAPTAKDEASLGGDTLSTPEIEGTGKIGQAMPPEMGPPDGPPAPGSAPLETPLEGAEGMDMPEADDPRPMDELVETIKTDVDALSKKIQDGNAMDGGREIEPVSTDTGSTPAPPPKIAVDQPAKDYWQSIYGEYGKMLAKDSSVRSTIVDLARQHNKKLTAADITIIQNWLAEDPYKTKHVASLYSNAVEASLGSPGLAKVVTKLMLSSIIGDRDYATLKNASRAKPHIFAAAVNTAKLGDKMAKAMDTIKKSAQKMKSPKVSDQPDDAVEIIKMEDVADTDEPTTRKQFLDIVVEDHRLEGELVTMELAWEPDDGFNSAAVKHALISFVKGLESTKEFVDLGHLGQINVVEMDTEAGVATVQFKSSRQSDAPTKVVTD